MNGQEHLHDVLAGSKEIVGLVEQAMSQTGSDEDAEETVNEQRVENVLFFLLAIFLNGAYSYPLLVEQMAHDEVGEGQPDEPAERIPAERTKRQRWVPEDK